MSKHTAYFLIGVVYIFVLLSFIGMAKADTTLTYTACNINTCVTDKLYGDDADFFNCVKQGPQIVVSDLEQKSRHGYYIRKWVCSLGPRSESL